MNTVTTPVGTVHAAMGETQGDNPYAIGVCGMYLGLWVRDEAPKPVTCKRCLRSIAKGARQ